LTAFESIAVVGASLSGVRAAETLRREGYTGRLTLIGSETHWPPVDRPPLSKHLLDGRWDVERARVRTELDPGTDPALDLRLGRRAIALDLDARTLALDDDSTVDFDGLVIATGVTPRTLSGVQRTRGVHVLRTADDSAALRADIDGPAYIAVVGAGFIGCEVAATCRQLGHPVSLVEAFPLPLGAALGDRMGEFMARLHRENGVDLYLGQGVAAIEGDQRVDGVRLVDGTLVRADVVVLGIGVSPMTDWLEGSGIVIDNGVLCDATLAAHGVENVVACGDVARWPHELFDGDLMRVEHWTNAAEQAEHAARTLLRPVDEREPFTRVPYFWSEQFGTRLQFVGTRRPEDDVVVVEGGIDGPTDDDGKHHAVVAFVRGDERRVVGALCINRANRTIEWTNRIADRAVL
jgi:3-phenylpropionate/trans-cinnamate dioxygenase ferredoxin reductase subunit